MDIEAEIRTVVERNPRIQAKDLIEKVCKKTGKGRSTIYVHIAKLVNRGKIEVEKGKYWLKKPSSTLSEKDKLEMTRLAYKIASDVPPSLVRDVTLKAGNYKVEVKHE